MPAVSIRAEPLGAGIDANGAANQPGSLALVADGAVAAVGQNIATDHIGIQGASLHLAGARTTAGGNVDLTATAGDIDHAGANLLAGGSSNVSAAGALNNRQGEIHANQLNIHAANLDNQQGRLIQTGAAGGSVDVASTLDNRNGGLLQTNGDDLTLTPQTLLNDSGTIAHAGKGALTIGATGGSLGSNQGGPGMSGTGQSVVGPDGKLPNLQLPTNQLYQLHPQPGQSYLIVTDPAFTNYQQFLSSDYLLGRLGIDPQAVQKRLGDGYYEQQLITSQVAQLTGRRYLDGYRSNEDAYRALMDAGVAAAQQFQLTPGVALTDAQMAALTSDIVWLVTQTVTLPDGSSTEVLAPVLYLARANAGDVRADGALIAGQNIDLSINGSLANGGTLQAGSNLIVNASGDISNSGRLQSTAKDGNGTVILAAQNDVRSSGSISGNRVGILAGRDIDLASTTSSATSKNGSNVGLNQIASVRADQLSVQSGRDINLNGAAINTTGDAAFVAGRDINLNTVTTQATSNVSYGNQNHLNESQTIANGASMQSGGNITLAAGQDVNANAAYVNADQALTVAAGRDVNITSAQQTYSKDQEISTTSKGMLSSSTYHYTDQQQGTQAVGSTFSGDSVQVVAGNDINVKGSNVVGTHDVTVAAGNNVNIVASQNTAAQSTSSEDKTSGMFSSGGIGFTAGSKEQQNTQTSHQLTHNVSMIGSTDGNVVIQAGNAYTQTGSNVLTPKGDTTIVARSVDINAAIDTSNATQDSKSKQSGITVAVTNPIISAVQTGQQMSRASGNTDDARMKVLAGAATALAGYNAANDIAANPATAGGVTLSVSAGTSKSESHAQQHSSTAQGSNIAAGGNVNIIATGGGQASNIHVSGSNISAGSNANLIADNNIHLQASQNTFEQHSDNTSSSGSIGISVGTNSGFAVTASAAQGRGNADGQDITNNNTHVTAGNQLTLVSGGDTNLIGAVASANKVLADVGGNLHIESLQDASTYNSAQKNTGIGVTIPVGAGAAGVNISTGNSGVNSHYQSVTEQSGIKAGDGGFDVKVAGNTNLVGGVIASTDKAVQEAKNSFTSGSLTHSDLQNQAAYDAKSTSISAGVGTQPAGNQGAGVGLGSEQGSANSTTHSGISGMAGNTAVRSDDAETGIGKIFDQDKVQKNIDAQTQITLAFSQQAPKAIGTFAGNQADQLKQQANNESDPDKKAALLADAAKWEEGGIYRVALHTAAGALGGGVGGALGAGATASAAPLLGELQANVTQSLIASGMSPEAAQLAAQTIAMGTAAGLGAVAGGGSAAGAGMGLVVDANNRQLHPTETDLIKKNAARFAKEIYGTDNPTQEQITAATSLLANTAQYLVDYNLGYNVPHSAQAEAFLHTLQAEYSATSPNLSIGNGQYLFYATPDQMNSPYINSGNVDPSIANLIAKNPITTPSTNPVYSASNPYTPANACISAECIPVGKPGTGLDYLSVSANFYLFSGGGVVNLHNGDMFGQWGLGRSYPGYSIKPGISIVAGNIIGGASAQSTSNFLQGAGASGAFYYPVPAFPVIGAGGGLNHGYGGQTSIEGGFSFPPGAGVTPVGYGFEINKKKEQ